MAYIKLEDLQKFPIRIDHYDKEHGSEKFVFGVESVLEYAEHLPTYDVNVKSEAEWTYSEGKKTMKCTRCRLRMKTYDVRRYCPNCGVKMKGGEQE